MLVGLAVFSLAGLPFVAAGAPIEATTTVLNIVDGDTINIRDDNRGRLRVRLLGIDTPETKKPGYSVGCWGPEASQFANDTMLWQRVALQPGPTQDTTDRERQASGGDEAKAQATRLFRGREFVEWVEHIKQLRRDSDNDEAMSLLMECIDATERVATANGWPLAPWYTDQAAIVLRKRGDLVAEVAMLERFSAACPHDRPQVSTAERLLKARAKLDRMKE